MVKKKGTGGRCIEVDVPFIEGHVSGSVHLLDCTGLNRYINE